MSYRYTDIKIPHRKTRGGKSSRSVFDADRTGRWKIVTQEELFTGSRHDAHAPLDVSGQPESDQFTELIRMMRAYQVTEEGRRSAFLRQARWMESYEEEGRIPETEFYHQYAGYQEMDVWELHGYFAWRTSFRRDESVPYCYEYMRLHAAELVNLIGVSNRQEAFERLLLLQALPFRKTSGTQAGTLGLQSGGLYGNIAFGRRMTGIPEVNQKKLSGILAGFVVLWEAERQNGFMDRQQGKPAGEARNQSARSLEEVVMEDLLQAYCIQNPESEEANIALLHYEETNDAALWRMIRFLAAGRMLHSEFLKEANEDAWRVMARVFRSVCLKQQKTGAPVLAERLLGARRSLPRDLFPMIPCETRAADGCIVEISPATSYRYQEGCWYRSDYSSLRDESALRDLNELVRECERVLRKKLRYRNQLQDRMKNPVLAKLIADETDRWLKEKALRNRPVVQVDLSRLGAIRDQAAVTRERLLEGTEEGAEADALYAMMNDPAAGDAPEQTAAADRAGEAVITGEAPSAAEAVNTGITAGTSGAGDEAAAESTGLFSPLEATFLQQLIAGGNGREFFREHKLLPSAFVDAVNEKAFDEIGDSIVEEDGAGWQLVEDYIEEVSQMLV